MSVEQKRADLEKALAALDESEIEAVAGGLSKKGKEIMKGVAIGAGVVAGVAGLGVGGYALHKRFKGKGDSKGSEAEALDYQAHGMGFGDEDWGKLNEDSLKRESHGMGFGDEDWSQITKK